MQNILKTDIDLAPLALPDLAYLFAMADDSDTGGICEIIAAEVAKRGRDKEFDFLLNRILRVE